jgi:hypothetical protein
MAAPAKPNLVAIVNASMNSKHCTEINTITSAVRAGIGDEATSNRAMEPWNPPTLLALRCYHRFLPSAPFYSTVSASDPSRSHTFTVFIRSPCCLKPYLDKEYRVLHTDTFISLPLLLRPCSCRSLEFAALACIIAFHVRPLLHIDCSPWMILQGWANLAAVTLFKIVFLSSSLLSPLPPAPVSASGRTR